MGEAIEGLKTNEIIRVCHEGERERERDFFDDDRHGRERKRIIKVSEMRLR